MLVVTRLRERGLYSLSATFLTVTLSTVHSFGSYSCLSSSPRRDLENLPVYPQKCRANLGGVNVSASKCQKRDLTCHTSDQLFHPKANPQESDLTHLYMISRPANLYLESLYVLLPQHTWLVSSPIRRALRSDQFTIYTSR